MHAFSLFALLMRRKGSTRRDTAHFSPNLALFFMAVIACAVPRVAVGQSQSGTASPSAKPGRSQPACVVALLVFGKEPAIKTIHDENYRKAWRLFDSEKASLKKLFEEINEIPERENVHAFFDDRGLQLAIQSDEEQEQMMRDSNPLARHADVTVRVDLTADFPLPGDAMSRRSVSYLLAKDSFDSFESENSTNPNALLSKEHRFPSSGDILRAVRRWRQAKAEPR